jgi:hypothetical protein
MPLLIEDIGVRGSLPGRAGFSAFRSGKSSSAHAEGNTMSHADDTSTPETEKMAEMTRELAEVDPETPVGSGGIAWSPADGDDDNGGMSQNEGANGQPLDGRMAQQFHQPAQGNDREHAASQKADDSDD